MNPYANALKLVLPQFGPYIDQQFEDQSVKGVSRGIKRFVNSLDPKKVVQAANQIDEWKRTHVDESAIKIVECVREGLRVKNSLRGIFLLSKNSYLGKMNRYVIKEAILQGLKKNNPQIANQIKHNPEYINKVGRILLKVKKNQLKLAQEFCFSFTQELVKEEALQDRTVEIVTHFNDHETAKRIHDYYSTVTLSLKEVHPFKTKLEKAFPHFAKKEEEKPNVKKNSLIPHLLIGTMVIAIVGFALSYLLGTFIVLGGLALTAIYHRYSPD